MEHLNNLYSEIVPSYSFAYVFLSKLEIFAHFFVSLLDKLPKLDNDYVALVCGMGDEPME